VGVIPTPLTTDKSKKTQQTQVDVSGAGRLWRRRTKGAQEKFRVNFEGRTGGFKKSMSDLWQLMYDG